MTIVATTLSGAITSQQTSFGVASATGIAAPNFQTGSGITLLYIDQEQILVIALAGTVVSNCVRGYNGTPAQAHASGSQVQVGLLTDFATPQALFGGPSIQALNVIAAMNRPATTFLSGLADAIPAGVPGFYVIKSAAADLMTLAAPTAAQEGNIIEIWSDAAFAHTITATSLLAGGTALKTTATFPAFRGAGIVLRVCNLVYHVLSSGNGNVASFVVLS
jgi:hypothetical protein